MNSCPSCLKCVDTFRAAGQNSGEIQTRVHHVNWSNFNTTETYSFISDPSFVYKDTQTVTLYQNGALIWGVEPTP